MLPRLSILVLSCLIVIMPTLIGAQEALVYSCQLDLYSNSYANKCNNLASISAQYPGPLRIDINSASAYPLFLCLSYGFEPDYTAATTWNTGSCPNLFQFKPAQGNKNPNTECPAPSKNGTASRFVQSMGLTDLPTSNFSSQYFFPQSSDNTNGYYVAAAITSLQFINPNRTCSSSVMINIYAPAPCPANTVGPSCVPLNSFIPDVNGTVTTSHTITVDNSQWVYYSFNINDDFIPNFVFNSNWTQPPGQNANTITTYFRYEGVPYPNVTGYDQKTAITSWKPAAITIKNPRPGQWYLAFQNTGKTAISGVFSLALAPLCTKAGQYGNGCVTIQTFDSLKLTGQNASFTTSRTGTVTSNSPTYIIFNSSQSLFVSVATQALSAPSVYLGAGYVPSASNYTFLAGTGQQVNRLITSTNTEVTWVLAIVADLQESIPYTIWVDTICADDCLGRGYCPDTDFNPSGLCICNATSGKTTYENFECQVVNNHTFQLEYIVLIAVGGAIILSIVIGIPVYCAIHRRSSMQSGYTPLP